jgi:hypothetical protein
MRIWRSALIAAIAVLGLTAATTVATATNGPAPHVGTALSSDVQFFYYPWYGNPTVFGAWRAADGVDPAGRRRRDHLQLVGSGVL